MTCALLIWIHYVIEKKVWILSLSGTALFSLNGIKLYKKNMLT